MDPREALIRHEHSTKVDREAEYTSKVFQRLQPKPIYSKKTLEADLDEEEERKRRRVTTNH